MQQEDPIERMEVGSDQGSLMYDKACFACLDFKYIFIGKNKKKRSINKF